MKTRTLLAPFAALTLAAAALAQTAQPAPATPAAPAVAPAAAPQPKSEAVTVAVPDAAKPAAGAMRDKDTLSVDFPDEDIKTILRNVADLFELNLVIPDTLTGKTSIKLRDVTWSQIFKVVLSPIGYTYIEEGNIIKIVSKESMDQETPVTEVIILNNARAADIKPTIDGLVEASKGGKILLEARSNALIITERPSRLMHIRSTIDQLDKATDQVMIESKFIEVSASDVRNIGVNWSSLSGMTLGATGISQTFSRGRSQSTSDGNSGTVTTTDGTTRTVVTTQPTTSVTTTTSATNGGTTGATSNTTGTLLTYDKTTGAPIITAIPSPGINSVTSTTTNPTSSTTTTTVANNGTTNDSTTTTNGVSSSLSQITSLVNTNTTSRLTSAVFSASDFNIIISALQTMANTKVVSNPTVVTLNNIEASINVGEEDPIPHYAYNTQTGTYEVTGFDVMKIGVLLKVTPQVNSRGIINLKLSPEVSQKNGYTTFGSAQIPIKATRSVTTQVALKDGYTVGLGGLVTNNLIHGGTKVPVIGNIPVLGRLFSSKSVNDQFTNLLIFVTARTVNPEGAAPTEIFKKEDLDTVGYTAPVPVAPPAKKIAN